MCLRMVWVELRAKATKGVFQKSYGCIDDGFDTSTFIEQGEENRPIRSIDEA